MKDVSELSSLYADALKKKLNRSKEMIGVGKTPEEAVKNAVPVDSDEDDDLDEDEDHEKSELAKDLMHALKSGDEAGLLAALSDLIKCLHEEHQKSEVEAEEDGELEA